MRHYECTYILDSALSEEELGALSERFRRLVLDQGGAVDVLDRWERRRLAYEVKGKREGTYYVMNFTANPGVEAELQRVLRLTDGVLRHIVVRLDDVALKHMQAQAAQRAQAAAVAAPPPGAAPAAEPVAAPATEAAAPAAGPVTAPTAERETTTPPTAEPERDEATPAEVAASKATEAVES